MATPYLAYPTRLAMACPRTTGGLRHGDPSGDLARRLAAPKAWVRGFAARANTYFMGDKMGDCGPNDHGLYHDLHLAAASAYAMAGITRPAEQIRLVEPYIPFSVMEPGELEALGLCGPGRGSASSPEMGHFDPTVRCRAARPAGCCAPTRSASAPWPGGRGGPAGPAAVRRPPGRGGPHRARRRGRRVGAVLHRRGLLHRSRRGMPAVPMSGTHPSASATCPRLRRPVVRATIDRPEARNAIRPTVVDGLEAARPPAEGDRRPGPRGPGGRRHLLRRRRPDCVLSTVDQPGAMEEDGAFTRSSAPRQRPRRDGGGPVRLGGRRRGLRPGRRLRVAAGLRRGRGRRSGPDRRPPPRARPRSPAPADRCGCTRPSPRPGPVAAPVGRNRSPGGRRPSGGSSTRAVLRDRAGRDGRGHDRPAGLPQRRCPAGGQGDDRSRGRATSR